MKEWKREYLKQRARREHPVLAKLVDYLEDCCEKDRVPFFPLIDPNRIDVVSGASRLSNYLGSEEFLGTNAYLWKELYLKKGAKDKDVKE